MGEVVVVALFVAAGLVGTLVPVGQHHQVIVAIGHVGDVNPLAGKRTAVVVSAARGDTHVAAREFGHTASGTFQVKHAKAIFEAELRHHVAPTVVHAVFGIALIVVVVVAFIPLKLVIAGRGRADEVILVADVLNMRGKAQYLARTEALRTTLINHAAIGDIDGRGYQGVEQHIAQHLQVGSDAVTVGMVSVETGSGQGGNRIKIAGTHIHAARPWTEVLNHKGYGRRAALGARVADAYVIGLAGRKQRRHLGLHTAKIIVIGEGSLVGIIKVGHVAVIVNPDAGVA